jgi:methionine synthase II (cobalamin-independent)
MENNNVRQTAFEPEGRAVLIGSLPGTDHREAMELILACTPEIPLWPQLPDNHLEGMLNQFVEGLPCVIEDGDRTYFHASYPDFEGAQLQFYEEYLQVADDPGALLSSRFQISPDRAAGLYRLAAIVRDRKGFSAVKGQITGPFTLLAGLKDQDGRLGYYDPTIRDMAVKHMAMKAAWQVHFLQKAAALPVLLFIDEPALAGLGSSAFISIAKDDIAADLAEVIDAVHLAGGLAGVHVCANTDWSLLLGSAIDILSFDAYNFFDRFITCRDEIRSFLDRGGIIAWGIVPTLEEEHISRETPDSLVARWEQQAAMLAEPPWDLAALLGRTLITPSCGTGSLSLSLARRVLSLTRDVSMALRKKYRSD